MGYDISYHPIAEAEMNEWYFGLDFSKVSKDDYTEIIAIGEKYKIDEFYVNKYIDTVRTMYNDQTSLFDLSHGFAIPVIQGFLRQFHYTRGTAFSFLIEEKPYFKAYTKKWEDILSRQYNNPIANMITQNYSSGIYIPADKVVSLLDDFENKENVGNDITAFFESNLPIFLKVLNIAKENNLGVLEATEVIEPNPLDLNSSTCYSNLFNCDPQGAFIYEEVAKRQIAETIAADKGVPVEEVNVDELNINRRVINTEIPEQPKPEKKSFWKKLFGKK